MIRPTYLLPACGLIVALQASTPYAQPQPKAEPKWSDISKTGHRIGDVSVSLASASLISTNGFRDGRPTVFPVQLCLSLKITNHTGTRKIDYRPWSRATHPDSHGTQIQDEFGNVYKFLFRPGIRLDPMFFDDDQSLYPDRDNLDTLWCEVPIAKAQVIRLALPAAAVGQKGTYYLEFPASQIGSQ